jgi:hypothetical protein
VDQDNAPLDVTVSIQAPVSDLFIAFVSTLPSLTEFNLLDVCAEGALARPTYSTPGQGQQCTTVGVASFDVGAMTPKVQLPIGGVGGATFVSVRGGAVDLGGGVPGGDGGDGEGVPEPVNYGEYPIEGEGDADVYSYHCGSSSGITLDGDIPDSPPDAASYGFGIFWTGPQFAVSATEQ